MKDNHCEMHMCSDRNGALYVHFNNNQISVDVLRTGMVLNFALTDIDCKKLAEMLMVCYNLSVNGDKDE